jgi:peptidoglycan hydrolase CwlO-like protein
VKALKYYLVIGIAGVLALFFFVTFNVRLAEMNKDIAFQNKNLEESAKNIEKISDDVQSLQGKVLDDLSLFRGELKSLNDRFALFIDLFRQKENKE